MKTQTLKSFDNYHYGIPIALSPFLFVLISSIRLRYYSARQYAIVMARLLQLSDRRFLRHVAQDYWRFLTRSVKPIEGETRERAQAVVSWLRQAQQSTPDDGVSFGYFPCAATQKNGWRSSYPETTGYIIPSLLDFSERFKDSEVRQRALRMAIWETKIQMASGAVQAGSLCEPDRQLPAVFNTGMVLHGYTAAYRETNAPEYLEAGRRAADFLLSDIGDDGHFKTHGPFVEPHPVKTYNCLCAWPLYRFGEDTREGCYQEAAIKAVEATLAQQLANGWFSNNCISEPEAPLSHTIAYALQGMLEVGSLAGREDFIAAARKGADPLLQRILPNGFLPGRFYSDWRPAVSYSCLTGNAQFAVICYRLHELTGEPKYRAAADLLVNFLKAIQIVNSDNPMINGAIPGSFPMIGGYMSAGYPNWAAKYFLDALMFQDRLQVADAETASRL